MINMPTKKAGDGLIPLPLLLFTCLLFFAPPLEAGGGGEYSSSYQDALKSAFEEGLLRLESGDWDREQVKSALSKLRTQYRVDYNDYAGKIDALIDEVGEKRKESSVALGEFLGLQASFMKERNRIPGEPQEKRQQGNILDEQGSKDDKSGSSPSEPGAGSGGPENKK